jgi:uncharacterized membrane protein
VAPFAKVYIFLVPIFAAVDFLWLGVIMSGFYKAPTGPPRAPGGGIPAPVKWAAAVVWLLIPLGIILFVLPRSSASDPYLTGLGWGFLYGVILYAVYDLTNYAMLDRWSLKMTCVDILWGGIVCGLGSCIRRFSTSYLSCNRY